jgi:hypothetical protein
MDLGFGLSERKRAKAREVERSNDPIARAARGRSRHLPRN